MKLYSYELQFTAVQLRNMAFVGKLFTYSYS